MAGKAKNKTEGSHPKVTAESAAELDVESENEAPPHLELQVISSSVTSSGEVTPPDPILPPAPPSIVNPPVVSGGIPTIVAPDDSGTRSFTIARWVTLN